MKTLASDHGLKSPDSKKIRITNDENQQTVSANQVGFFKPGAKELIKPGAEEPIKLGAKEPIEAAFSLRDFTRPSSSPNDGRLALPSQFLVNCEPETLKEVLEKFLPVMKIFLSQNPEAKIQIFSAKDVCKNIADYLYYGNQLNSEIERNFFITKLPPPMFESSFSQLEYRKNLKMK